MSAIKKDYYDDDDDEYDRRMEAIDEAYREADRSSHPISILLDCYNKYEEHDPIADAVANDDEALAWLGDYWAYVKYNEHGNEASMEEVGGFKGFANTFYNADQYIEYLMYDDYENIDDTARDLVDRLRTIAQRYGGVSKMKKADFKAEFDKQVAKNRGKEKNRVVKRGKAPTPSNYADDDERARLAEYLENYNGHGGDKSLANAIAEWIYPSSWD